MTPIETKAIETLQAHPQGLRASDLGWELWGATTATPGHGVGAHGQNKFCRPAGKLLKRLRDKKEVYPVYRGRGLKLWFAVEAARPAPAGATKVPTSKENQSK